MSRLAVLALASVFFVSSFGGCGIDRKDTEKAAEEVAKEVSKLKQTVADYVQTADAPEEFKKLLQWEYKLISFPLDTPPKDFQDHLNEFGKERWDCFHVERVADTGGGGKLLLLCKRRPDSALKYLPRHLIGNG